MKQLFFAFALFFFAGTASAQQIFRGYSATINALCIFPTDYRYSYCNIPNASINQYLGENFRVEETIGRLCKFGWSKSLTGIPLLASDENVLHEASGLELGLGVHYQVDKGMPRTALYRLTFGVRGEHEEVNAVFDRNSTTLFFFTSTATNQHLYKSRTSYLGVLDLSYQWPNGFLMMYDLGVGTQYVRETVENVLTKNSWYPRVQFAVRLGFCSIPSPLKIQQ